jgi:hypothetical protein
VLREWGVGYMVLFELENVVQPVLFDVWDTVPVPPSRMDLRMFAYGRDYPELPDDADHDDDAIADDPAVEIAWHGYVQECVKLHAMPFMWVDFSYDNNVGGFIYKTVNLQVPGSVGESVLEKLDVLVTKALKPGCLFVEAEKFSPEAFERLRSTELVRWREDGYTIGSAHLHYGRVVPYITLNKNVSLEIEGSSISPASEEEAKLAQWFEDFRKKHGYGG